MKVCPKCNAEFEDNINFCLNDGSPLTVANQRDINTENFSAPIVDDSPTQSNPTAGYTAPPAGIEPESTVARPAMTTAKAAPARNKTRTILLVVLGICLLGIIVVVLGVAGMLYYLVYQQPAEARTNSNSIIISNLNSSNSDSDISNTNTIALGTNTNSGLSSNSSSIPTANTNAANRKVTPSPSRTIDVRATPEVDEPPPPPTPKPLPKTISGGVMNGKAISLPKPAYPPAARAVRAGGSVNVEVLIDESGRVISAHAVSGNPLLTSAAEAAARGARFSPTLLSGQAVKVSGIITYNFVP